jgi:hypothetical protein
MVSMVAPILAEDVEFTRSTILFNRYRLLDVPAHAAL